MVLSFIMAGVLFWSIAGSSGGKDNLANPTSGATLDNVPVQIEGLNKSLEISGVPEQVTVGLIGPSLDLSLIHIFSDIPFYTSQQVYQKEGFESLKTYCYKYLGIYNPLIEVLDQQCISILS